MRGLLAISRLDQALALPRCRITRKQAESQWLRMFSGTEAAAARAEEPTGWSLKAGKPSQISTPSFHGRV